MKRNAIKITACVIAKNEEENLPRWLECMQALADEIVVVDTGSTDGTVKLAQEAGAKIFSFPWCDDFAAAKNYALDQCSGRWVLMLDADEYIEPKDYEGLRESIAEYDSHQDVIGVVCNLVNVDKGKNNAYISTACQIRVFRRLPSLRYTGAIHELLQYTGKGKKNMPYVDTFTIYHTGYSRSLMPEKYRRNLKLLEKSMQTYGKRTLDDLYLADCYYGLQQYRLAAKHAQAYVENPDRLKGEENRSYGILIQALLFLEYPFAEIQKWVKKARAEFPYAAEFRIMEGYAREAQGEIGEALKCYHEALRLYEYAKAHQFLQSDEAGSAIPDVRARMARLEQEKKDHGEKKRTKPQIEEKKPANRELVTCLQQIEKGINTAENIEHLWHLCEAGNIDFERLQDVMQQHLQDYERTLQILAASLQDS